ncbi:MAG TPA: RraA family protein [Caldilinea sp.]|nr:RraA family protein [Caldilinea sp.]
MLSLQTIEKLRGFDTPTICNLIELFDVRPRTAGYTDARIVAAFPEMAPIVGFAATATHRTGAPPRQGDAYGDLGQQVERFAELSGPPIVVFQDLDDPALAATFGEVMCTIYQAFGAVGLITSGAGRDIEQVRALNFPVFTNGTICSHGYNHIPQVHVPVRVGGLTVFPDDLLHADRNGVSTIPVEIAAEVADIGDEFVAAETIVLDAMRRGAPTPAILAEARAEMAAQVKALAQRVARSKQGRSTG